MRFAAGKKCRQRSLCGLCARAQEAKVECRCTCQRGIRPYVRPGTKPQSSSPLQASRSPAQRGRGPCLFHRHNPGLGLQAQWAALSLSIIWCFTKHGPRTRWTGLQDPAAIQLGQQSKARRTYPPQHLLPFSIFLLPFSLNTQTLEKFDEYRLASGFRGRPA